MATERFHKEGQRQTHQLSLGYFRQSGFEDVLLEFIQDHRGDGITQSIDGEQFEA